MKKMLIEQQEMGSKMESVSMCQKLCILRNIIASLNMRQFYE